MSSLRYLYFTDTITKIGGALTLSINSFLIWITVFHIKNINKGYRKLILSLAYLEIVFSILEVIVQPFVHCYNSSLSYFTIDPVFGASKPLKFWIIWLYSGLYAFTICLIAVQFFYRFLLITAADKKIMNAVGRWYWVYCTFWSVFWMFGYYQCAPDKESEAYLREEMIKEYGSDVEEIAGFFVVAYVSFPYQALSIVIIFPDPAGNYRWKTLLCVGILSLVLGFQYLIIITSGYQIHRKIHKIGLKISVKAQKMQKQLFKTLIFQTLTPFLLHHIPAFVLLILLFLDLKISIPSGLIFCFYSLFPPIDSVILMILVTEYQVIMRKKFQIQLTKLLNWINTFINDREGETTEDLK